MRIGDSSTINMREPSCGWILLIVASVLLLSSLKCSAYTSPLANYEKLCENERSWLIAAVNEKATESVQRPKDMQKFNELGFSTIDTIKQIAQALYCASELGENNKCSDFEVLVKDLVIVLKDEKTKSLYFGYNFFFKKPKLDRAHKRNIIYERAQKAWEQIFGIVKALPSYEQIHVGYGTGGSIASLIATRMLTSKALPFRLYKGNEMNQIKVLTLMEVPVLTSNNYYAPVGGANYAAFVKQRPRKNNKGPSYHLSGTLIGTGLQVEEGKSNLTSELISKFIAGPRQSLNWLSKIPKTRYEEIEKQLGGVLTAINTFSTKLPEHYETFAPQLYGAEQFGFADQLTNLLREHLSEELDTHVIRCYVEVGSPPTKDEFTISCRLVSTIKNQKDYTIASYSAKVGPRSQHEENCRSIVADNVKANGWHKCLKDLVQSSHELSLLLSPIDNGDENCRFLSSPIIDSWASKPVGCTVKPTSSSDALFALYSNNPSLFFALIDKELEFPKTCGGVIKPISYQGEALDQAKVLGNMALEYFREMDVEPKEDGKNIKRGNGKSGNKATNNNNRNSLPPLFIEHGTERYQTRELVLKSSSTFVADEGVSEALLVCLSASDIKFFNCTRSSSLWVPGACPEFCSETQAASFCKTMTYCTGIKAYVGLSSLLIPQISDVKNKLGYGQSAIDQVKIVLETTDTIAQSALFSFSPPTILNRLMIRSIDFNAGIFFLEAPKLKRQPLRNLKVKKRPKKKGAKDILNDEDIWD